jgi:hypothetical protein
MEIKQKQSIFQHKVSKGSRYNQIYIPRGMEGLFQVGDVVEVRLVEKANVLEEGFNKKLEINDFKKEIIKQIFDITSKFKEVEQTIIFGSFLIQKSDYNDIDLALISDKKDMEKTIEIALIDKLPFKFHVISFKPENLKRLLDFCPLTRSMFYYSISNKKLEISKNTLLNKEHIEFLLMMPEDLLKINISNSRAYFDSLRRLITIIKFLKSQELDPLKINLELKSQLGEVYSWSKNNEAITDEGYKKLKSLILIKLKEARRLLNG